MPDFLLYDCTKNGALTVAISSGVDVGSLALVFALEVFALIQPERKTEISIR